MTASSVMDSPPRLGPVVFPVSAKMWSANLPAEVARGALELELAMLDAPVFWGQRCFSRIPSVRVNIFTAT
ncbi:hypothetical protein N7488_008628 [Penicillium malachiteum]|nr:hypothetical protein N7488_008628 [Penicillium malachiteum]